MIFNESFSGFSKMLGIPNFPKVPCEFLTGVIEKTYHERLRTGYRRNDIIDVCIDEMENSVHLKDFK